jgi:copper amine oxidase-like protein
VRIDRLLRVVAGTILIGAIAAGLASVAGAQTVAPYVKVVVDGSPIYLDAPPMIVNGRVLVPLRGVFERLGATVIWDPASQTVRAQNGPTGVALTIGASQAVVNGQPQSLDSPALLVGGRTMVPLRFISQALGANVNWDAATYTVQIASQGAAAPPASVPPSVSYPPGQVPPAPYPGQTPPAPYRPAPAPQPPAQPAVQTITGTVTQVNAAVYPGQLTVRTPDGPTYTYQIVSGTTIARVNPATGLNGPIALSTIQAGDAVTVTGDPSGTAQSVQALNYTPAPQAAQQPPAPPGAPTVTGAVTDVNASAYPGRLIVQASNGAVYTYQIVSGTTITRMNTTTGVGGPVPLSAIQAGDAVTVAADPTGTAQSVQVSFAEITGTIASAAGNQIALQDGQTYMLAPTAQVTRDGQLVPPAALQPGGVVTLRVNPATRLVYGVILRQAAAPGAITAVTVTPAGRRLVAGDVMTVVAAGPPHDRGTFAIAGLRAGLPMTESATQPGTYIGTYVVQPGDAVANGSVVVSLTAPNGQVLTATAPAPVSISAAPLPVSAGAPVIISPTAGKGVTTPFTVTGTALPGSQVKVTADYDKNIIGFHWHGTLGTQTVTADANGNWSATFNQKPPVRGVNLTITAALVDNTGAVRSVPATVNTTLE